MGLWRHTRILPNLLKLPEPFMGVWLRDTQILDLWHSDRVPIAGLLRLIKTLPENPDASVTHFCKKVFESAGETESVE
jgi:hypothetical protein